jgi:hypothetical protein
VWQTSYPRGRNIYPCANSYAPVGHQIPTADEVTFAVGGVFVGGGIAPKVLPVLQDGSFLRGFTDEGRFTDLMKGIEVSVALNPAAALIGAVVLRAACVPPRAARGRRPGAPGPS